MAKLPVNLSVIRGFEAAARHLSFTLAAQELGLTQGAVSRQVSLLERDLGAPLFQRFTRRIELTPEGVEFLEAVRAALYVLTRGADSLRRRNRPQALTVSVLPTIGAAWLMPRLHTFTRANAGIDVRIVTSIEPANLTNGEVDVAIRVGAPPGYRSAAEAPRIDIRMVTDWDGIEARPLFPDILLPVISAKVHRQQVGRTTADILRSCALIHTSTRRHGWPDWLKAQGLALKQEAAAEFGHFFMALDEARAGRGIALVPSVIMPNLEGRRQLRVLECRQVESAGAYFALARREGLADSRIRAFLDWLDVEAADLRRRL